MPSEITDRVTGYAKLIQQAFLAHIKNDPRLAGMATTWTCAYVTDWDAIVRMSAIPVLITVATTR